MLKKYLKNYKLLIAFSLILVIVQVWSMLYQPEIISQIMTELSRPKIDTEEINKLGINLIIIGAIGLLTGMINTIVAAKISQGVATQIRDKGFKSIQKLSFQDIEKFTTSNLVVRLTNDITQIQNMLMLSFQIILRVPFLFVGAFIAAIIALPGLWWTIILYVVIVAISTMIMGKLVGPKFGKIQKGIDKINTIVKENIDGVRVVKSFVGEKKEKEKFDKEVESLTEDYIYTGKVFSAIMPIYMLTANLLTAVAIYFVAGWAIDDPELIGSLISFMTYIMLIMFSIIMAGFLMMSLSRARVSIKRVSEVLDTKPSFSFGTEEINNFQNIEFQNISFKYPKEEDYVLKNISFTAQKGEKIGVVGATGSGKTTLVQLIPALYVPQEGTIKINQKNLLEYSSQTLRKNISMVLQKAELFSGTIKDVILQGNLAAKDLDLEIAAKRAQADEFIQKKENKYEGEVLQKGANFSGGQKQRLSIARGLVKNPEILILDDSTSALDAKSENLVKEAIKTKLDNTLVFIVAQKISSVIDTDKILVLNKGELEAIGTHQELLKISPTYKEIYETQKGKEID